MPDKRQVFYRAPAMNEVTWMHFDNGGTNPDVFGFSHVLMTRDGHMRACTAPGLYADLDTNVAVHFLHNDAIALVRRDDRDAQGRLWTQQDRDVIEETLGNAARALALSHALLAMKPSTDNMAIALQLSTIWSCLAPLRVLAASSTPDDSREAQAAAIERHNRVILAALDQEKHAPGAPKKRASIFTHGISADCPQVQLGTWERCMGHLEETEM
jgi:hypothetical protein